MSSEAAGDRRLRHLLALSVITLAVYLTALKAGFLAVDDTDTIKNIQSGNVSLSDFFLSPSRLYFRPMAMLSLLTDFHLYGGSPAGYHLTNLLLHLANVLLVYYLATCLLGKENNSGFYPFMAALVFAGHPINSEAVVWISARPDLLCCFFFLLCMVLLVKRGSKVTLPVFAGLFATCFCSLASKEASLFLPLLAAAYLVLKRESIPVKSGVAACTALLLATLAYLLLRKGLPLSPATGTAAGVPPGDSPLSAIIDGTATVGFYLGKLIYPFPLQIAITEIPVTTSVGIFLLCVPACTILWRKQAELRFPIAFLWLSLIPPLGALFLTTAWTPYAERYLYLPSVAFALCAIMVLRSFAAGVPRPVVVCCVVLAATATAYRVNLWTKPIAFWQDAIAKSPRFATLGLPLAAEYIEAGRYTEAKRALRRADQLGLPSEDARAFSRQLKDMIAKKGRGLRPKTRTPATEAAAPDKSLAPPHQTK